MSWEKKRQWLYVLSKSGTTVFVSISEAVYTDEVKKDVKRASERVSSNTAASMPIDWTENLLKII